MRARRLLAWLHSTIGAAASLFLLAVCLSGALLAFDVQLFRWQHPMLESVDPARARAADPSVDALLAAATNGYGRPFEPIGVLMPHSRLAIDTAMVYGQRPGGGGLADTVMLVIDPATGAYRGDFLLDEALGHQVIHFHQELFAGEVGATFVALLGLLLAAFAATGLYLWWPRRGGVTRKARAPDLRGRPLGRWFRLHGWVGFWSAFPILLFALTGTAVSRPAWFGGLLAKLPYEPPATMADAFARACPGRVSPDQAIRTAATRFPGQRLASFGFAHDREPYRLTFKSATPLDRIDGDSVAFVHATCAGVVRTATAAEAGIAGAAGQLAFSIHSGRSFGPVLGPALVLIAGLAATMLAGSGLYVWVARKRTRRPRERAEPMLAPAE